MKWKFIYLIYPLSLIFITINDDFMLHAQIIIIKFSWRQLTVSLDASKTRENQFVVLVFVLFFSINHIEG